MLKLKNINTYYGKVHALKNVSLHLSEGEIVTLIGANGAGKTTILNTISGLTPAAGGDLLFCKESIKGLSPDRVVHQGISQVPEGRQVFKPMSVDDNLELGAYLRYRNRQSKKDIQADKEYIFSLFPRLKERQKQAAGTMSGGEQQMLAIGRALMARPRLLLLDEPSMGLAPLVVQEIFRVLQQLRDEVRESTVQEVKKALQANIEAVQKATKALEKQSDTLTSVMKQKVRELEESKNSFFRYEGLKIYLFWGGMVCNIGTFLIVLYYLFVK
jgi:branched-chain amino acid transport system ATP-binding protein